MGNGRLVLLVYALGILLFMGFFGMVWLVSDESERSKLEKMSEPTNMNYKAMAGLVALLWPVVIVSIISGTGKK